MGLPLFHQWYYFLFLYSILMCVGTAWVYFGAPGGRVGGHITWHYVVPWVVVEGLLGTS